MKEGRESSMPRTAGSHYDFVTDTWKEFMGDHFHFGYFETEVKWWKNNALRYRDSEINAFLKEDVQEFIYGCETLDELFNDGVLGYGIVPAIK